MKILFCGLGSIGQKHLQNLVQILQDKELDSTIDALRFTDGPLLDDVSSALANVYKSYEDLPGGYDIAFVTNPTAMHVETIRKLKGKAANLYIEKPVFAHTDVDLDELGFNKGVHYVACPLRHHPVIRRIKELTLLYSPSAVRVICSSYLPDWRPNTDYRTIYSARRELGGGVTLDLIHEWDYLSWLFGLPQQVRGFAGHLSDLEIDSDDVAVYIAQYPGMVLTMHLDYIGQPSQRSVELFTSKGTILGDIWSNTVTTPDGTVETFTPQNTHYLDVAYFIQCVLENRVDNMNTPRHALTVLEMALSVQEVTP